MAVLWAVLALVVIVLLAMLGEVRDDIKKLESDLQKHSRDLTSVRQSMTNTHNRLLDGLWTRAQADVDRQIELARARFRP